MFTLNKSSRLHAIMLGTVLGLSSLWSSTANAETTLRLAHASAPESLINEAVQKFATEVGENTKGSVKVQIFPNAQLGDEGPIADGVGAGSIDIGLGGAVDAIDPRLNVLSLPFLFKDASNVHAFLDGEQGQKIQRLGEERGYVMLGVLDSGFRQFATSKPIEKPADLAGVKIRTPPNPVILATMKQLGALAESIPFGQVYTALQSHVVAAVEPEMRDYWDSKWYEVAKDLSISNYIWTANWWYMNKDKLDSLTPDEQAAVKKAATDTVIWYRSALDKAYADTQKKLEGKGVKVTKVDTAPFVALVSPVYAQFSKEWGSDLVSAVKQAASAN
ncbi:DctP family TRAP transporter solute-binding subunit [Agrobacterium vitis]|uniref:DctP family TRAP transporter solute-binding subunit n=1 Tax=Agrobacterium vitis TaxID=373 RepID=A0ABD6GB59_AGRVI|nr:TRAP transporter substrate-binding protein [Agrobacterium vitis]MUO79956.1 DctP family TRAP transporter solute-binding subunit [Agrobacterium vitis]MUO93555.1 DctP family TRAP transporter solute-binding subunit [Agrobacterium vitis]MUP04194.1 DctP family TRAP transporter solute-binding subunit [Agrobacterium vitis]MUZ84322.1 DctP family TRAP transporter solute-binding subunit [Agrobacterium vitis]MVA11117.1 DctP family TRAP transporter solute-binding subunit [Agrobacterium vitis]